MNDLVDRARMWAAVLLGNFLALTVAIAFLIAFPAAHGMSGAPYTPDCVTTRVENSAFDRTQCELVGEPYQVPELPGVAKVPSMPASMIVPRTGDKLQLIVHLHGYVGKPTACVDDGQSQAGAIVIKVCEWYYPNQALYGTRPLLMSWFGAALGENPTGWVIGEMIDTAMERYGSRIDAGRGFTLRGFSQGGTGTILQTLLLPPWWGAFITQARADVPHTLFVNADTDGDEFDERGQYFRDPAVRAAWGDFDIRKANFRWVAALGGVNHIYYRINGATNDSLGRVDLDFFRICDEYRIACFGTWHQGGHNQVEKDIALPFTAMFNSAEQETRLNQVLPIFTRSTANHWGPRGHYNLGLAWSSKGIVDTADQLTVPVRYRRLTNIGGGIPDQPEQVMVTFSARRMQAFRVEVGEEIAWKAGAQSGTVKVERKGEITVPNVILDSSDVFTPVEFRRALAMPPIAYVRMRHHNTPVPPADNAATQQLIPELGCPWCQSESDLVIDRLDGSPVTTVHNCEMSPVVCAALEVDVSPDGKKLIYAVALGDSLTPREFYGTRIVVKDLLGFTSRRSQLWVHDIPTGKSFKLTDGFNDRSPKWRSNHEIVFTSDRAMTFAPLAYNDQPGGPTYPLPAWHTFIGRIDGQALVDVQDWTPHAAFTMSPAVLSDGSVCWQEWQGGHPVKGKGLTPANLWPLVCADSNGANQLGELGWHGSGYIKTRDWLVGVVDPARAGEGATVLKGLRLVVQLGKDEAGRIILAIVNYYRGNMMAGGIILKWPRSVAEGVSTMSRYVYRMLEDVRPGSGRYVPEWMLAITPYGTDQDTTPRYTKDGRSMGRTSDPAPWPGDGPEWMYTQLDGDCYKPRPIAETTRAALGGVDPCHKSIRLALQEMVTNPWDRTQSLILACGDGVYHCWGARAITDYDSLFGQAAPDKLPPLSPTPFATLQIVDGRMGELAPFPRATPQDRINWQGNADDDFASTIAAFRLMGIAQHRSIPFTPGWLSQTLLLDCPLEADGSAKCQVPCETPMLHQGVNKAGEVVAADLKSHSYRCGSTETCHGCHDGHSEERVAALGKTAQERFKTTLAGRK